MEVHLYTGKVFRKIYEYIDYRYLLCLTATLPDDLDDITFITSRAPVIAHIDTDEAINSNYITDFQIYNLPIEMSFKEELDYTDYNKSIANGSKYFSGYDIYNISNKQIEEISLLTGVAKGALFGILKKHRKAISNRLEMFYHNMSKINTVNEICNRFTDKKIITFNVRTKTADLLEKTIPNSIAIHGETENSVDLFEEYKKGNYSTLHATKKLSTGIDDRDIDIGIVASFNSSSILAKQQVGRIVRLAKGKYKAIIVFTPLVQRGFQIGMTDTNDLKYLEKNQRRFPSSKIKWINKIEDII